MSAICSAAPPLRFATTTLLDHAAGERLRLDRADHLLAPAVADERVGHADARTSPALARLRRRRRGRSQPQSTTRTTAARRAQRDAAIRGHLMTLLLRDCPTRRSGPYLLEPTHIRLDFLSRACSSVDPVDCAACARAAARARRRPRRTARSTPRGPTTRGARQHRRQRPRSASSARGPRLDLVRERDGRDRRAGRRPACRGRRSRRARRRPACRGRARRRRGRAAACPTSAAARRPRLRDRRDGDDRQPARAARPAPSRSARRSRRRR